MKMITCYKSGYGYKNTIIIVYLFCNFIEFVAPEHYPSAFLLPSDNHNIVPHKILFIKCCAPPETVSILLSRAARDQHTFKINY